MLEDKDINNNGHLRVWRRSKESQFFNRWLAATFILGFAVGIFSGLYIGGVI